MQQAAGLPNVRFLPLQPAERFNALLNLADIHLLIQQPRGSHAFMPSKLTGMLASERPVVATGLPGSSLAQVIRECGQMLVAPEPGAIVQAIVALACDPERRKRMGLSGRTYAERYWRKSTVLSDFEHTLEQARDDGSAHDPVRAS